MVGQVDEASEESSIKQHQTDQIIRYIGRLDIYDNSREYEIEDDCYIYEVILENNLTHYVSVGVYRVWSGLCDLRTDHILPRY